MKSNYPLFLIATTLLAVILSLFGSPASAQLSEKPQANLSVETKKPNVLFISIDDLNDWIGCLGGHPQAKTPNLDRLATRGTLFLNAHCQSPVCNPSRTSVMTGLRPSTTGIYSLQPAFRTVPSLKDYISLPKAFAANGYATSTCGKMYHKDAGKDEFETVGLPVKFKGIDWKSVLCRLKQASSTGVRGLPKMLSSVTIRRRSGRWMPSRTSLILTSLSLWRSDSIGRTYPCMPRKSGLISIPRSHSSCHRFDEMIARTRPASHGISTGPSRSHA